MRYVIEPSNIQKEISNRQKTANTLVEDNDPHNDIYDKRILYEVAKRKIDRSDYLDETS